MILDFINLKPIKSGSFTYIRNYIEKLGTVKRCSVLYHILQTSTRSINLIKHELKSTYVGLRTEKTRLNSYGVKLNVFSLLYRPPERIKKIS